MSEEQENVNYREEVLRLVNEGKIKRTEKYVEKATDETLEKIYKNYLAKQLDETNEHITNTLIGQISELMTRLNLVDLNDKESLEKDLGDIDLFKRDVKNVLSYVTPYIPSPGLVCGGFCVTKYVVKKGRSEEPKEQGVEDPEEPKEN